MSPLSFEFIQGGGVSSPKGFTAAGVAAGLKRSGAPDLAIIHSEVPAVMAGCLTANKFAAAPVEACRKRLAAGGPGRTFVVNSGNANACTGERGRRDAERMAHLTAELLGVRPEEVFPCSTGRIGVPMPMDIIEKGVRMASEALVPDGGESAARAIMTTDTRPKRFAIKIPVGTGFVTIGGMAKGAGMIAPRLDQPPHATMLVFLTTDARCSVDFLRSALWTACDVSFNRVTIDGDTSTNDTALIMANGLAGNSELHAGSEGAEAFTLALKELCMRLAREIALDGEGATKLVHVIVRKAASDPDARLCAEAIANSLLCKTAWFGNDPNWGRVVAAAGRSGASFDPAKVSIHYDAHPVVLNGGDAGTPEPVLVEVLKQKEFNVIVDLACGSSSHEILTCDISYEYVKINADYHT